MTSITIRNLDDALKRRLRLQAAEHGRSMEEEARDILRSALNRKPAPAAKVGTAIRALFEPMGGVDLEFPERQPIREPPRFD